MGTLCSIDLREQSSVPLGIDRGSLGSDCSQVEQLFEVEGGAFRRH